MNTIEASLLKPGMVFSEHVYIDDNNLFIIAGLPLRQKDIDKLKDWNVEILHTNGIACPSKEDYNQLAAQQLNADIALAEVHENKGAYPIYTSFVDRMNMIFLKISINDLKTAHNSINAIAAELLQILQTQKNQFVGFIMGGAVKGNEMAKSAVNTAILSALIAQELKIPRHKVLNIIIGALLHDVGMTRLPKSITQKEGGLSEEDKQRVRGHPLHGHKIVTKELLYADDIGETVLQHHERWDGNGYPYHNAEHSIDMGARIVSVTDAFEAMVSQKSYRTSMAGYEAMKNLLSEGVNHFDPAVLKAFIQIMGIYPIGSFVSLNNGIVARVVESRANNPLRPKVQVIIDEKKQIFKHEKGAIIDLQEEQDLFITQAMDTSEISRQYAQEEVNEPQE